VSAVGPAPSLFTLVTYYQSGTYAVAAADVFFRLLTFSAIFEPRLPKEVVRYGYNALQRDR